MYERNTTHNMKLTKVFEYDFRCFFPQILPTRQTSITGQLPTRKSKVLPPSCAFSMKPADHILELLLTSASEHQNRANITRTPPTSVCMSSQIPVIG